MTSLARNCGHHVGVAMLLLALALTCFWAIPAKAHGSSAEPSAFMSDRVGTYADQQCLSSCPSNEQMMRAQPAQDGPCGSRHHGSCNLLWCSGFSILSLSMNVDEFDIMPDQSAFPTVDLLSGQSTGEPFRPPRRV